jgi:hypothetical protein
MATVVILPSLTVRRGTMGIRVVVRMWVVMFAHEIAILVASVDIATNVPLLYLNSKNAVAQCGICVRCCNYRDM